MLVILGLLTGGILAGQSLIRASELRTVTNDYNRYVTAANTFRDKYMALPGDINNATSFWGALDGGDGIGTDCSEAAPVGITTCNGDGNGVIERFIGGAYNNGMQESFRFWQHLANAGLIEGKYSGNGGTGTYRGYDVTIGTNIPASKIANAGWHMMSNLYANGSWMPDNLGNNLFWLGTKAGTVEWSYSPFIKPEEAWNIDTKMDDGKPMVGTVTVAAWGSGCANAASSADFAAAYNLSATSVSCAFIMKLAR